MNSGEVGSAQLSKHMPKIAKNNAVKRPAARAAAGRKTALGALPEWNLNDLYSGLDDPAIKRDLDRVDAECVAFENAYKGKLAAMAAGADGGSALAEAVRRYEAIDDLMGRLGSYAGLVHAGNTVDPARTKFYGDMQERMTAASTHLLFFTLELNRIDDALLEARDGRSGARPLPAVARRRAPLPAVSARGSRRAVVSRKIGDRLFRLEPAVRRHHRQSAFQGVRAKRSPSSRR